MLSIAKSNVKKTLSRWMLAMVLVAGFFSGYASNFSSEARHKTQTEWVVAQQNLLTKTFRIVYNNKLTWGHSEISFLVFQNRLIHIEFTVNIKRQESFSQSCFVHSRHFPQTTDEDLIAS